MEGVPAPLQSEPSIFIIQTLVSSLVILIFAEFLPKTLFRVNPNRFLSVFALPVTLIYYLLYPIIALTLFLSNRIMKAVMNTDMTTSKRVFDAIDMDNFLKEFGESGEEEGEEQRDIQIFRNAIEFPDVKLRECMVPRTEVVAVSQEESIAQIRKIFSDTGLSKVMVYNDSIDDIMGYVHAFDFFAHPSDLQDVLRPVLLVPETMYANKLLKNLIQQRKSVAVVVDEFGGTAGIITIEDIIEEIFGEIDDEYDVEDMVEKETAPGEYLSVRGSKLTTSTKSINWNCPNRKSMKRLVA